MSGDQPKFIVPDWPAPVAVRSAITTRLGGYSLAPYDGFNLASHVGDQPDAVEKNRQLLRESLSLPEVPCWINQVHGIDVVDVVDVAACGNTVDADGSYSASAGQVSVVLTADCLPVLLCNQQGTEVAALHAGWRGLASGILAAGVDCFQSRQLMAYLGPAIGPASFEVGRDVYDAFLQQTGNWGDEAEISACFVASGRERWLADIYALARLALRAAGVTQVYGGEFCTFSDQARFYSYRRDGDSGRMASLIWIEQR